MDASRDSRESVLLKFSFPGSAGSAWEPVVEWRGLNVAELAKSFGLPGNSPKAYAASATSSTKASGRMVFTGRERLLPIQSQARQEPLPPIRITGR